MDITKVPLDRFSREIWPFLLALILVLILVTYVPAVVLLLPEMIYGP
jgi:C4-dicarboxylate transporter DctM subunit